MKANKGKIFKKELKLFEEMMKINNYSDKSIISYLLWNNEFLSWITRKKKNIKLQDISFEMIRAYLRSITDRGFDTGTVHVAIRSIKRFFKMLEEKRIVLMNPAEEIGYPKLKRKLPQHVLTEEEMEQLLNTPDVSTDKGIRERAIIELLYSTGIRREECANLRVSDIYLGERVVRINLGKGGKDRIVPLGKIAAYYLDKYIKDVRAKCCKPEKSYDFLFLGIQCGRHLKKEAIGVIVREIGEKAGIGKPVTVHSIRRTFATHLVQHNAPLSCVQRLLGHSRLDVLRRYVQVKPVDVKNMHHNTHPRERGES